LPWREDKITFIAVAAATFALFTLVLTLIDVLTGHAVKHGEAWLQAVPYDLGKLPGDLAYIVIVVGAALFARWIRPPIEVSPPGQTRLLRVTRYVAGVILGLGITAFSARVLKV
jgi:hypothetical protein